MVAETLVETSIASGVKALRAARFADLWAGATIPYAALLLGYCAFELWQALPGGNLTHAGEKCLLLALVLGVPISTFSVGLPIAFGLGALRPEAVLLALTVCVAITTLAIHYAQPATRALLQQWARWRFSRFPLVGS